MIRARRLDSRRNKYAKCQKSAISMENVGPQYLSLRQLASPNVLRRE